MKLKSLVILSGMVFLSLAPLPSFAGEASCSSIECSDEIDRIYVTSSGGKPRVYVSIEDRTLAGKKLACTLVSGWYFTLSGDHPAFDQIYSLLVEAKNKTTASRRNRVTIRIVDNSPICEIGYVFVAWPND